MTGLFEISSEGQELELNRIRHGIKTGMMMYIGTYPYRCDLCWEETDDKVINIYNETYKLTYIEYKCTKCGALKWFERIYDDGVVEFRR